jgi:hypothetical protein
MLNDLERSETIGFAGTDLTPPVLRHLPVDLSESHLGIQPGTESMLLGSRSTSKMGPMTSTAAI